LLGVLNKKAKEKEALSGFTVGILTMIVVISLKIVAWTWFTLIGVIATLFVGTLLSRFNNKVQSE
jgi:xanthine/uracil permease